MIFGQCFGEKKQINLTVMILGNSFCISGFLYELILNTAYSYLFFFRSNICIPFLLIRTISTLYQTIFSKFVKMYTIDQYVLLEMTNTNNKTFDYILL